MKDIYKTYRFEDFLLDDEFVEEVRKSKLESKLLSEQGELSGDVLAEARRAASFILASTVKKPGIDTQALWERIDSQTSVPETATNKPGKVIGLNRWLAGIAAAFLLIWSANIAWKSMASDNGKFETLAGEIREVLLPDGSLVNLNAKSSLSFDKETFNSERTLNLKGEAFFTVKKGSSFVVKTDLGQVTVLGTTFNVYVRNEVFSVECKSGKVKVDASNGQFSKILLPDESVELNQDKVSESVFSERNEWRFKKLEYKGANPEDVISDLERQLGVEIEVQTKQKLGLFSGVIPLQNHEKALESFTWPLRLKYRIHGNKVEIY